MNKKFISVKNVSVDYPLLGRSGYMLRNVIVKSVLGGKLHNDSSSHVTALNGVSLDIGPGDAIGLVGTNGSGKSTLLRVLTGVLKPCSGEIIRNARITSLLTINLGMLDEATGFENARIMAVIKKVPKHKREKFISDVVEVSELQSYMHLPLRTYSSGMRLRLAFAVAILVDVDVIIMDEIIGVADKNFRQHMMNCIKSILAKDKALVLASHSEPIIADLCNQVIEMEAGKIVDRRIPTLEDNPVALTA